MDLKSEILYEHSRRQVEKIARWIGADKRRFRELMELFLHGEYRVTQRAAWIINKCAEKHPRFISPWLKQMIAKSEELGVHIAVKRNVLRILEGIDIPKSLLGTVVSRCFDYLASDDEAIAVRVYAMEIILHAAQEEPDLRKELQASIEQMLIRAGPAIRARARRVLKRLDKLQSPNPPRLRDKIS